MIIPFARVQHLNVPYCQQ